MPRFAISFDAQDAPVVTDAAASTFNARRLVASVATVLQDFAIGATDIRFGPVTRERPSLVGTRVRVVAYCGKTDLGQMSCDLERENARLAIGHVGTVTVDAGGPSVKVEPSPYPSVEGWFPREELEVLPEESASAGEVVAMPTEQPWLAADWTQTGGSDWSKGWQEFVPEWGRAVYDGLPNGGKRLVYEVAEKAREADAEALAEAHGEDI